MGWKRIVRNKVEKLLSNDLPKKVIEGLVKDKYFLINSNKPADIHCVSKRVLEVFNQIKSQGVQPLYLGERVCDTQDLKKARLSLSFARKAAEHDVPRAVVNNKAEQLFLYTRDVWSSSIIRAEGNVKRRRLVFIFNQDGLFLGLAFATGNKIMDKGRTKTLRNVIDIGYYLRAEG